MLAVYKHLMFKKYYMFGKTLDVWRNLWCFPAHIPATVGTWCWKRCWFCATAMALVWTWLWWIWSLGKRRCVEVLQWIFDSAARHRDGDEDGDVVFKDLFSTDSSSAVTLLLHHISPSPWDSRLIWSPPWQARQHSSATSGPRFHAYQCPKARCRRVARAAPLRRQIRPSQLVEQAQVDELKGNINQRLGHARADLRGFIDERSTSWTWIWSWRRRWRSPGMTRWGRGVFASLALLKHCSSGWVHCDVGPKY